MKSNTELEFSDICVHYTFAIFTGTINASAVLGRRAACLLSNSGFTKGKVKGSSAAPTDFNH